MEQLQNFVEVFVQVVLVEHEDGLASKVRDGNGTATSSQDTRMAPKSDAYDIHICAEICIDGMRIV